jgi:hypothetical protein
MRLIRLAAVLTLFALPLEAATPDEVDRIWAALRMPEVIAVMRDEGIDYGQSLDEDMLDGQGGARWQAVVDEIYDAGRIEADGKAAFTAAIGAGDLGEAIAFFEGPVGAKAVAAELEARRAMLDPEADRAARRLAEDLRGHEEPRYLQLERFAEVNDLIESNISGALNANLAFFQALGAAGALDPSMDESAILSEVWSGEPQVRDDTQSWVMGFLALSYQNLSDDELDAYVAFSATPAGQELNQAIITSFDGLFTGISGALGSGLAPFMIGQDL